jgi:collagenase-like PrtC family protease
VKLTVAANYDMGLVSKLAGYPVDEVFGKFPADFAGGGRPTYMGTPLTHRELGEYVTLLNRHGIAFNYLLNSACLANREWSKRWQKKLMSLLDKLGEIGVTRLTVSTPFLLEIVKARFPHFRVKVGIFAQVDTALRVKFWENLGADAITLESFSINRDFARLAAIREVTKCDLQLIANHCCLPNCPMQYYHQNGIAHSSDGSKRLFIDYCFLRCSRMRLEEPTVLIKAGWIRPEDVGIYEKMGYTTFKILERGIPSEELLKRVRAYSQRQFDGNLAELIFYYGFREPVKKKRFWLLRHFFRPLAFDIRYAKQFFDLIKGQGMAFGIKENPYYIDTAQIPANFLDGFNNRDCAMSDCDKCGYCDKVAQKAVTVNSDFRTEFLRRYAEIERLMAKGELWGA